MNNKTRQPLVKMSGIYKNYGNLKALRNVNFEVFNQEVVGLLGDNGAGKTTLLKVLLGLEKPNSGEIYLEGKLVKMRNTAQSRNWGMEASYQNLALVPEMDIVRNFFLGREILKKYGLIKLLDIKKMREITKNKLKEIGIRRKISPDTKANTLSGGEQQSIGIGRATYFGAKILILDEPTASLSINETNKVLGYVKDAKRSGLSVIFITHNIYHVYEIADRFVILEEGAIIGNYNKEDVTAQEIIDVISKGKIIADKMLHKNQSY